MPHFSARKTKPSQGNQNRFPQDLARTHIGFNKEAYGKINQHYNGTPMDVKTRTAINQRETSGYRPGRQKQKNVFFYRPWNLLQQKR